MSTPVDPQLVENLEELPEGYYLKGDVLLRVGASISNPDEIITTWYRSPGMSHLEALGTSMTIRNNTRLPVRITTTKEP